MSSRSANLSKDVRQTGDMLVIIRLRAVVCELCHEISPFLFQTWTEKILG